MVLLAWQTTAVPIAFAAERLASGVDSALRGTSDAGSQLEVTATVLAPPGGVRELVTSASGLHVLSTRQEPDGSWTVFLDGAKVASHAAQVKCRAVSDDGHRYIYSFRDDRGQMRLVVDGTTLPGTVGDGGEAGFSPDGRRYWAMDNTRLLLDGKWIEGGRPPVFDSTGAHFAYVRFKGPNAAHGATVVTSGGKSFRADGIQPLTLAVTSDGRHVTYVAGASAPRRGQVQTAAMYVDGTEGKSFNQIAYPVAAGGHVLYSAVEHGRDGVGRVMHDEREVGQFTLQSHVKLRDAVTNLALSADGSRYGYVTWRGDSQLAVVGGAAAQKPYAEVDGLALSADGRRFAYVARSGQRTVLVIDGVERDPGGLGFLRPHKVSFSPDGTRLAVQAGKSLRVFGGKAGEDMSWEGVESWRFFPSGNQVAVVQEGGVVNVDDVRAAAADRPNLSGSAPLVVDSGEVWFTARGDREGYTRYRVSRQRGTATAAPVVKAGRDAAPTKPKEVDQTNAASVAKAWAAAMLEGDWATAKSLVAGEPFQVTLAEAVFAYYQSQLKVDRALAARYPQEKEPLYFDVEQEFQSLRSGKTKVHAGPQVGNVGVWSLIKKNDGRWGVNGEALEGGMFVDRATKVTRNYANYAEILGAEADRIAAGEYKSHADAVAAVRAAEAKAAPKD